MRFGPDRKGPQTQTKGADSPPPKHPPTATGADGHSGPIRRAMDDLRRILLKRRVSSGGLLRKPTASSGDVLRGR